MLRQTAEYVHQIPVIGGYADIMPVLQWCAAFLIRYLFSCTLIYCTSAFNDEEIWSNVTSGIVSPGDKACRTFRRSIPAHRRTASEWRHIWRHSHTSRTSDDNCVRTSHVGSLQTHISTYT